MEAFLFLHLCTQILRLPSIQIPKRQELGEERPDEMERA